MAVLSPFRELSLCRQVHREFMRSTLLDLTPIISATVCHQRNYIERYRRYSAIEVDRRRQRGTGPWRWRDTHVMMSPMADTLSSRVSAGCHRPCRTYESTRACSRLSWDAVTRGSIRAGRRKTHASPDRTGIHHGTQRAPARGVDGGRPGAGWYNPT